MGLWGQAGSRSGICTPARALELPCAQNHPEIYKLAAMAIHPRVHWRPLCQPTHSRHSPYINCVGGRYRGSSWQMEPRQRSREVPEGPSVLVRRSLVGSGLELDPARPDRDAELLVDHEGKDAHLRGAT